MRCRSIRRCLTVFGCLFSVLLAAPATVVSAEPVGPDEPEIFFESRVRPLLVAKCYSCHGPDRQESDLRLDSRAAILEGGASGDPAAVPGDAAASLMIAAIRGEGDYAMPPEEELSEEEIDVLRTWIDAGLTWPSGGEAAAPVTMADRLAASREAHWAFRPIDRAVIPPTSSTDPSLNSIDAYIQLGLADAGLSPAPEAPRATLLRRLKFDLLGLPPAFEEISEFENDSRPGAYERWVDRFLASPRFGERWGRHWLDVARYADTSGYAFARDRNFPFAYTYRDYVIRSFNQDLAYDRFIVEQLAADRIELGHDNSALAALGFLTVGRRYNNIHDDLDDRIDVVTRGLMGLTVACARCHDHKYDAIPTEDYYSLYGVFASTQVLDEMPLIGPRDQVEGYQEYLRHLNEKQRLLDEFINTRVEQTMDHARREAGEYLVRVIDRVPEDQLKALPFVHKSRDELVVKLIQRWRGYVNRAARPDHPVFGPWAELVKVPQEQFAGRVSELADQWHASAPANVNPLVRDALIERKPASKQELAVMYGDLLRSLYEQWVEKGGNDAALRQLSVEQRQLGLVLFDDRSPTNVPRNSIHEYLDDAENAELNRLRGEVQQISANGPRPLPRAMAVTDRNRPVQPFVFQRGNARRRGKDVPRQFLAVLEGDERTPFTDGSGRLELARRIADPANPLTSRVFVNRVWMHLMGSPLVASPSDFGIRSERPSQAELLDYLADTFVADDWSIKSIARRIVLSRTYRQSSASRSQGHRVDPDNQLYWRMNRKRLTWESLRDGLLASADSLDLTMGGESKNLVGENSTHRRAVYGRIDRQDLPNLLRVFDLASPDQSAAQRTKTIVPQQALFLLNNKFAIESAQRIASQTSADVEANTNAAISRLFERVLARVPNDQEVEVALKYLDGDPTAKDQSQITRWERLAHMLLLTNEFTYVD